MSTPNLGTPTFTVPANGSLHVAVVGDFVTNLTTSTAAGSLTLQAGDGRIVRFNASDTYIMPLGETFDNITLNNTTGGDIVVQCGIGQGEIRVANAVTISNTVTTTLNSGATLVDTADVAVAATTAVKVVTGTANDKTKVISNLVANGTKIRVGSSAVGAARGVEVANGGSISLDTQADVWVYNPAAGGINIGVLVLRS